MKTALAALALVALPAAAAAAPPATTDYRSTTSAYTPYREAGIADWRTASDAMGQLNGHTGHMGRIGGQRDASGGDDDMRPARPATEEAAGHQHHIGGQP